MPTRKTDHQSRDAELAIILSNPFAGLDEPWTKPDFPMDAAQKVWKRIRKDVLAKWERNSPWKRPWAWYEFDAKIPMKRKETEADYLRRTGQFNETEKRLDRKQ